MTTTTISSREFNQDISRAKRAAETGPVIITDRGEPAWVLLRHEAWTQLRGESPSILELLAPPGSEDFDFEPPKLGEGLYRPAEFP